MKFLLVLAIGLPGMLFLGLAALFYLWHQTEGIVAGYSDPDAGGAVRPFIKFDHAGNTVTITGRPGARPYRVGQKVPVYYLPQKPEVATIADFRHFYLFRRVFLGVGLITMAIAVLLVKLLRGGAD